MKGLNRIIQNNVQRFMTNAYDSATDKRLWYNDSNNNNIKTHTKRYRIESLSVFACFFLSSCYYMHYVVENE